MARAIQYCVACRKGIAVQYDREHRRIAGHRYIHGTCHIKCDLCGKDAEDGRKTAMFVNRVVHEECKRILLDAKREAAEVTHLPEARGWADAPSRARRKYRR